MVRCLVEMQACQWRNQEFGRSLDSCGIFTHDEGLKFYKLDQAGKGHETLLSSVSLCKALIRSQAVNVQLITVVAPDFWNAQW